MKLSELKTGMVVTTREGNEYIVYKDAMCYLPSDSGTVFVNSKLHLWHKADENFTEELTHKNSYAWDVIKVEVVNHPYCYMDLNYNRCERKVLWERQEVKEVTMAEVEAKFGCKVKIVK